MTKKALSNNAGLLSLVVLQGPDRGRVLNLQENHEYIIGRSHECDFQVDQSDRAVSRKHVRIKAGKGSILVENLSQTNPVQINGKAVSRATVKAKGQFQVGITLFSLEMAEASKALNFSPSFKLNKKIVLLAGLLIVCLFFLFVLLTGKDDTTVDKVAITSPSKPEPDQFQEKVFSDAESPMHGTSGVKVSVEDREKSEEHFRHGMFFYDTGNSLKAVGEWKRALSINPENSEARTWFLKAEKELEEKARTHYQNAILHYKYMRYKQALDEFRMVVEFSRDKNSEQYINSIRYMNELKGR